MVHAKAKEREKEKEEQREGEERNRGREKERKRESRRKREIEEKGGEGGEEERKRKVERKRPTFNRSEQNSGAKQPFAINGQEFGMQEGEERRLKGLGFKEDGWKMLRLR